MGLDNQMIFIMGASGCGKSTVADILTDRYDLKQVKSYTTRPRRNTNDNDHTYVTDDEFDKLTDIIAWTEFDNYRYCATKEQYNNCDVYVIDPAGFINMMMIFDKYKWKHKKLYVVWIAAPEQTRIERMHGRGDGDNKIKCRINNDKHAFSNDVLKQFIDDGRYPVMYICSDYYTPDEIANNIMENCVNDRSIILPADKQNNGGVAFGH